MIDRPLFRWAGTLGQIAGALVLASRTAPPLLAYAIMLGGAVLWAAIAAARRDWPLGSLMGAYVLINIVGLTAWAAP